jgi:hypothetical protein
MIVFHYDLELAPEHGPRCSPVECWWLSCACAGSGSTSLLGSGLDWLQLQLEFPFGGFNLCVGFLPGCLILKVG